MNNIPLAILVSLSILDTQLTYSLAKACINWKPSLKLSQVESNPFICVCWNNFGLFLGTLISGVILLGVQFALASIHVNIYYIIVGILVFANLNHIRNFWVLNNRLKKDKK